MSEENQLYLILRKEFFDQILEGSKKEEYRDFTDFYINKFCVFDKDGNWIDVKKYNSVRFQLGYSKKAPQIIVEFKELTLEEFENNDDEYNSENCRFVIHLGNILEKTNC